MKEANRYNSKSQQIRWYNHIDRKTEHSVARRKLPENMKKVRSKAKWEKQNIRAVSSMTVDKCSTITGYRRV